MTLGNGKLPAQAIPLVALLPPDSRNPRFYVVAQWETPGGVLLPKRDIQVQALPPQVVVQLFVQLVNQGLVHQVYTDEQGQVQRAPLPVVVLEFGKLPERSSCAERKEPMYDGKNGDVLRVCTHGCAVQHYENCIACLGFGLYVGEEGGYVPASASMAMDKGLPESKESVPCPTCHSTISGVPASSLSPEEPKSPITVEGE